MTSTERYAIQSMSMDLKRVALGVNSGSIVMAEKFLAEAKKRKSEIKSDYPKYILDIFSHIDQLEIKRKKTAEVAMMYSTLLQNFSIS